MADLTPKRCPRKTSISTPTTKYKVAREHGLTGKINQIISVLVKGGIIELIGVWNEDGTDDGFDPALKNTVRENGTFAKKAGLFKLAERRAPPGYTMHEYMPSPQSKKKQNGDPFPRHWYMRLVNSNSPSDETTVEVRKQIAMSVAHFLRNADKRDRSVRLKAQRQFSESYAADRPSRASAKSILQNHYVVPDHWDQTPETQLPLDHYVTDFDIAYAINNSLNLPDEDSKKSFARMYPVDASFFFSEPPYPPVAQSEFGYVNPKNYIIFNPEETSNYSEESERNKEPDQHAIEDYFGNCND